MKALQNLALFIRAKDTDDERHEIREYVATHVEELAHAFDLPVAVFQTTVEAIEEDARLAEQLRHDIKAAQVDHRYQKATARITAAQTSADVLGSVVVWENDRAVLDIVSLLASALTSRSDALIFSSEAFTVAIPMSPLFDVRRLDRFDLTGYVDARGLHIRWRTGGLNFCPHLDRSAPQVIVHLPARAAILAA